MFLACFAALVSACGAAHSANLCGGNGSYAEAQRSDGVQTYCSYVVIVVGFRCPDGLGFRAEFPASSGNDPGLVVCSDRPIDVSRLPAELCSVSTPSLSICRDSAVGDAGTDARIRCGTTERCFYADGARPTAQANVFSLANNCMPAQVWYSSVGASRFEFACCTASSTTDNGVSCGANYFTSREQCEAQLALCR